MNAVVAALRIAVLLVVLVCVPGSSIAQSDRQNSPYGRCRAEAIEKRIIKCSRWMRSCNSVECTYDTVCDPRNSGCEDRISFGHMTNTGPKYCDAKHPRNSDEDINEVVAPICKDLSKAPDSTTSAGAPEPTGSSGPTVAQVIQGLALIDKILSAGSNAPKGEPGAFVVPEPAVPPPTRAPPAAPRHTNASVAEAEDIIRRFRDATLAKGESPCIEVATNAELTRMFAQYVTKASTVLFCFGKDNESKLFAVDRYVKFTVKGAQQIFQVPLHHVRRIFSRETRDEVTFRW